MVKSRGLARSGGRLGAREAFEFMRANQARSRIATMARVLGVSPSGFHAWRAREPSRHQQGGEALKARIGLIHPRSRGTCGAPRIHAELAADGVRVGHKREELPIRRLNAKRMSRPRKRGNSTEAISHGHPASWGSRGSADAHSGGDGSSAHLPKVNAKAALGRPYRHDRCCRSRSPRDPCPGACRLTLLMTSRCLGSVGASPDAFRAVTRSSVSLR